MRGSDHGIRSPFRRARQATPPQSFGGHRVASPEDSWTVPTYPGGSINVEVASAVPIASAVFGPEKTSTSCITLTLTIAPINCIEQEGTLESR